MRGPDKLELNEVSTGRRPDSAWEVLAEPIQTVMRRYGLPEPQRAAQGLHPRPADDRRVDARFRRRARPAAGREGPPAGDDAGQLHRLEATALAQRHLRKVTTIAQQRLGIGAPCAGFGPDLLIWARRRVQPYGRLHLHDFRVDAARTRYRSKRHLQIRWQSLQSFSETTEHVTSNDVWAAPCCNWPFTKTLARSRNTT